MGINIKNPETERLIRELAELTGEGQTAAVTRAVQERLAILKKEKSRAGMAERLLAIGRECAPLFKPPYDTIDHTDLLYDEKGLPK